MRPTPIAGDCARARPRAAVPTVKPWEIEKRDSIVSEIVGDLEILETGVKAVPALQGTRDNAIFGMSRQPSGTPTARWRTIICHYALAGLCDAPRAGGVVSEQRGQRLQLSACNLAFGPTSPTAKGGSGSEVALTWPAGRSRAAPSETWSVHTNHLLTSRLSRSFSLISGGTST